MARRSKLYFVMFLTALRFPLVVFFFIGAVVHMDYHRYWLFAVTFTFLIGSAVTDLLDGYFARRFEVETRLGAHMDPLLDKFFYVTSLPVLVYMATRNGHALHALFLLVFTVLSLLRDQLVTFLRSIGSMYNISGKANIWGKLRTCVNFPLICAVYFYEGGHSRIINPVFLYCFEVFALALNLVTIYAYTRQYFPYLKQSAVQDKTDALK